MDTQPLQLLLGRKPRVIRLKMAQAVILRNLRKRLLKSPNLSLKKK